MSQSPADGVPSWDAFSGDGPGCAPPPGPELAALLGEAVGAVDELDERQALGVGSAARRMRAHADYVEIMAVARFGRVRAAQLEASKARGDRVRSRDAEYAAEELGFEMTASAYSAGLLLDMAANIVNRLPSTLAGMAAGVIDRDRARVISNATLHLPDDLAAEADKILADAAPELRLADLQARAARLEARLDPEGVQRRKDEARHDRRVELRREDSGAACLSGRELDPAEALAGKASIDAEAVRLRNAGLPGTLAQIRAAVLLDRIAQRSPWDRLAPPPVEPEPDQDAEGDPGDDGDPGPCDDDFGGDPDAPDIVDPDRRPLASCPRPLTPPTTLTPPPTTQTTQTRGGGGGRGRGPPGRVRRPAARVAVRPDRPQDPAARPDQHHHPRRDAPRLVECPRRRRILGPDGPRNRPRPHRGRLPPPPHPLVLHLN